MNKTKIIVCGAAGKMGSSIVQLAAMDEGLQLAGGIEKKEHPDVKNGSNNTCKIYGGLSEIISSCDVVIDFTAPKPALEHLAAAEKNRKAMVIGTTGFSADEIKIIKAASEKIPIVFSPNMSIGVNLLFKLAAEVAAAIPNYDAEIVELHHNQKKDAPSGTAVKLSEIIADSLDRNIKEVGVYGRKGVIGPRKKEEIGVMTVRAGDIVGEHTVYFAGPGERIELTHRAHSRNTFASGALTAAKWIAKQKPGLYNMHDVINK